MLDKDELVYFHPGEVQTTMQVKARKQSTQFWFNAGFSINDSCITRYNTPWLNFPLIFELERNITH